MADSLKNPPVLSDDVEYSEWKNDLDIWELYTNLDKKKRGPALFLSLQGKAKVCARRLTKDQISAENGVATIVGELDKVLQQDADTRTFLLFKEFYEYRRPAGVGIKEFIIQYEHLYSKLGQFDIVLPQGVQVFFLLTAANISVDSEKLARATCREMKYQAMKTTILRIFF